jgi:hypothetical protein
MRNCICDKCGDTGVMEFTLVAGRVTRVRCDACPAGIRVHQKQLTTTAERIANNLGTKSDAIITDAVVNNASRYS